MSILGLDVGDTNLSFVHGIADELVFDVDVTRSLVLIPIVGHLNGPLVVLHDVDEVNYSRRKA